MDESHVSAFHRTAESDSSDRLSELPDSLILTILSLLPMRDAVKTTLLSKRWKNIWTTVAYLDFSGECCNFICEALEQWKGAKILEFSISFSDYPPNSDILDSWLLFAIEKQSEELYIDLAPDMDGDYYCLPQCLYSCSSIARLSLFYCKLRIYENVQWNQLKCLKIERAKNFLSRRAMNRILSGAPVLEELILWSLEISENFTIRSRSLKKLYIGSVSRRGRVGVKAVLRIWAPNLSTLEISDFFCGCCLLDVPSLTDAVLYFRNYGLEINSNAFLLNQVFRSICHVERVTLSDWCVKFLVYMKKKDKVVPFSNAKFLKLFAGEAVHMLHVLEMFPKLKMLIVDQRREDCNDTFPSTKTTSLNPSLLQLKTVEISWSVHDDALIIPAIKFLLQNAHVLEKMVLRPIWCGDDRELLLRAEEKLLSMPRSSPIAEVIIM